MFDHWKKSRKYISVALILAMSLMVFGCKKKVSDFPSVPAPTTSEETEITETTETSVVRSVDKLKAALPYDQTTVNYLVKLYYAKTNGYWNADDTGLNVDLEYLDSLAAPFSVETVYVPDDGISLDTLAGFGTERPDIFLVNDLNGAVEHGYCADLSSTLSENSLVSPDNVYIGTVLSLVKDHKQYGIPHYCSIPLIFGNVDYIPEGETLDFRCSVDDLEDYIVSIKDNADEDTVVFSRGYQLIPYITSYDNSNEMVNSYLLNSEYSSDKTRAQAELNTVVDLVGNYYVDGVFKNSNEDGSDPVYSRNCALWIASSAELSLWSSYYPGKLYFVQVPSFKASDKSVPYVTVYPLCVSNNSSNIDLASNFAAFISLDTDALLLIDRLEHKVGYLPVVSATSVWDTKIADESFGYIASVYENEMDEAVYCPNVTNNVLRDTVELKLMDCYNDIEAEEFNLSLAEIYEN